MPAGNRSTYSDQDAGERNAHVQNGTGTGLIKGLGWFSIGLGLAEVVMPSAVAKLIGVEDHRKNRGVLRGYGLREIAAGVGILTQPKPAGWLKGRVAGDLLDLSSLALAFNSDWNDKGRLSAATAAVLGVTALDVICARQTSADDGSGSADQQEKKKQEKKATKAIRAIAVDRSPEDAYNFWHDFQNLPRFMTYLDSVRTSGDRKSHWTAKGPAGMTVEWDAEVLRDEPNRLIEWQSVGGAMFANKGSVSFERAPGQRGTIVRVELDFAPNGGPLNSVLGKILGADIGRRIMHDLRHFKQILEIGEVTESDASIHPGMHAAQPAELQHA